MIALTVNGQAHALAVPRDAPLLNVLRNDLGLNGMIVATVALLARHPQPSDAQVRDALAHNLCRCGAHLEILQAVQRAAALMAIA